MLLFDLFDDVDLELHCLSFLAPHDVLNVLAVCRRLQRAASSDQLWQPRARGLVSSLDQTLVAPAGSWRHLFQAWKCHTVLTTLTQALVDVKDEDARVEIPNEIAEGNEKSWRAATNENRHQAQRAVGPALMVDLLWMWTGT